MIIMVAVVDYSPESRFLFLALSDSFVIIVEYANQAIMPPFSFLIKWTPPQ